MLEDLNRPIAEIHSNNVDRLSYVITVSARKFGANLLPYNELSALSSRATALKDIRESQKKIAAQVIHLPFHFALLILTSEHIDNGTGAFYLNSLHVNLLQPKSVKVQTVNSPMIPDMFTGLSETILAIQGVQQPPGYACGMACLLNKAFALFLGSHEDILEDGIPKVLEQFGFPDVDKWTNFDFFSAVSVLVSVFAQGENAIPALNVLLKSMSDCIKKDRDLKKDVHAKKRKRAKKVKQLHGKQTSLDCFFSKANNGSAEKKQKRVGS